MSYSTRKAIAGMRKAQVRTSDAVVESVRRFDAAKTVDDIDAVFAWAKSSPCNWFVRTREENAAMHKAYERALARVMQAEDKARLEQA